MLERNSSFSLASSSGCGGSNQSSSSSSTSNNILLSRSSELKLDKVSQEERDAAHNLVSLHMQNTRSRCDSSASVSTASTIQESENIENTPEVVVAYETRSKPIQTYQSSKWSVPNVQKQPFFPSTSSSSNSSHFQQPMYRPYYSNHFYDPEAMNMNRSSNETAATASIRHTELMNPVSTVGRLHKYIEHPQCPPRRFNFAQF